MTLSHKGWRIVVWLMALSAGPALLRAQQQRAGAADATDDGQVKAEHMLMDAMAEHHMHDNNPHLRFTTLRPERERRDEVYTSAQ